MPPHTPAAARPGGAVCLCIMRRPPQGTKPRPRCARCGLNDSGDVGMVDHSVAADDNVDLSRRKFLTRATIATGAVGAVFAAVPFIESWSPSERARAQGAPTELDLSKLEPTDGHSHLAPPAYLRRAADPRHARPHQRPR